MTIEVRRATDRFTTETEGRTTRHSFSFDRHYDPANLGFGLLLAHNDDRLAAGCGYAPHRHRDVEIVTWVLAGTLLHDDAEGHRGAVRPGLVQSLSAGRGVEHSEVADAGGPVRFVQVWLPPDEPGATTRYRLADPGDLTGALVPVASGIPGLEAPAPVGNARAALHVARLRAGQRVALPDAPHVHVFAARGALDVEGVGRLQEADAARLTRDGGRRVTAAGPAEVLVWEMR